MTGATAQSFHGSGPTLPVPLQVEAELAGPVCLGGRTLALDALLAWAVAERDQLPPPPPVTAIEVPLARESAGRFHLASVAVVQGDAHELRYTNRRFPIEQGQDMGDARLRRIELSTGPSKSFRIPREVTFVEGDVLRWWCVGDLAEVSALLAAVTHLGKKRSVGHGLVGRWRVTEYKPWPGFPVLRDGIPLRPLPVDYPGLSPAADTCYATLTYPYWERHREVLCAVPSGA